jgi:dUTP pyrophosphatase
MYRKLLDIYPAYTLLKIKLTGDDEQKSRYINHVNAHNNRILNSPYCIDAGFDLISPGEQIMCGSDSIVKVNFQIKCMANVFTNNGSYNTGYYLYPRSSVIKTPLRLANSVGIIDAGYRGNIIGAFDCQTSEYDIVPYTRLAQLCAPGLMPMVVEIVDELTETERGEGGFGSTGSQG